MSEETNDITADAATQRGALPLRNLQLIGIFGPTEAPRALLRTAGGQIRDVGVNERMPQGIVAAIGEDRIVIRTPTGERTLRLPDLPAAAA